MICMVRNGEGKSEISCPSPVRPANFRVPCLRPESNVFEQGSTGIWKVTDKQVWPEGVVKVIFFFSEAIFFFSEFICSVKLEHAGFHLGVWTPCNLPYPGADICWSAPWAPFLRQPVAHRGTACHMQMYPNIAYKQGNVSVSAAHLEVLMAL